MKEENWEKEFEKWFPEVQGEGKLADIFHHERKNLKFFIRTQIDLAYERGKKEQIKNCHIHGDELETRYKELITQARAEVIEKIREWVEKCKFADDHELNNILLFKSDIIKFLDSL